MTVTQQVERDIQVESEITTSNSSYAVPAMEQVTMLFPRHVSPWCTSPRKRLLDFGLSIAALVFLWPLMLLVGLLVKLTSSGPALFRQERVGLHQKPFVILKFRTMKHSTFLSTSGSQVTKQGDSRLTEIGALLRRLKVDELPQLVNVARGEMSFVGPRPKLPQHENLSMACRPGITGAATIVFSHEERLLADIPESLVEGYVRAILNPEKCRLDAHYIETATFMTDMTILAQTIFKIGNRGTTARSQIFATKHHSSVDADRMEGIDSSSQDVSWLA